MGWEKFSPPAYRAYSASVKTKSRAEVFHRGYADAPVRSGQEVDVEKIKLRESCDSANNPVSTPVIVGLDVSGSMGHIAEHMAKEALGTFVGEILERKPITDPHLLFLAIGDAVQRDKQPLQATQFEADNRIVDQLTDLWLEGGGGGNQFESYDLAWAFAAYKTKTDAWEKRKQKGYLITIGDECYPQESSLTFLKKAFNSACPQAPTPDTLLAAARARYHVFHITIADGNYCRGGGLNRAVSSWRQQLQKRALVLDDYRHVAELMVSIIAINEGKDVDEVLRWWPQDVCGVLTKALKIDETQASQAADE